MPIIRPRCTTPRQWRMEDWEKSEARFAWQRHDEAVGFEVMTVIGGDSTVYSYLPDDTLTFSLAPIDTSIYTTVQVRKACEYITAGYDTIVYSDWTTPFTFGTPPPIEDTVAPIDTISPIDTIAPHDSVGILQTQAPQLRLSPNPAHGSTTLYLDGMAEGSELTLTDLVGTLLLRRRLDPATTELTHDLTPYPSGTYLLTLLTPRGQTSARVIVQ